MINLQYSYAQIELDTGRCHSCFTCSYEIIDPEYIPVPYATDDYYNKYYDLNTEMWYINQEKTVLWEECPSHNV